MDIARKGALALAAALILVAAVSCAHVRAVKRPAAAAVKTVYLWDADGYTDASLLTALKLVTARYLKSGGFTVTGDPYATDAYVKITVIDAAPAADGSAGYIEARLYVVDARDNAVIFDRTCRVSAPDGGAKGPEYPVAAFVRCALKGFERYGR